MKQITQQTFDEVVRENMGEFSMSVEEAIEDASKQFQAQGIDLSNIIKNNTMTSSSGTKILVESINKLNILSKDEPMHKEDLIIELNNIKLECDKDLPHKILAGTEGAYNALLNLLLVENLDEDVLILCLKTITSLMAGQPDLLNSVGIEFMTTCFTRYQKSEILQAVLKWIKECCIKHEQNRQNIFNSKVVNFLKPLLLDADAPLLKDVCAVLRALVLDDDVRVEFGKAHEHARCISGETLGVFTSLLTKHKDDESVINDLLSTLSALIVRNEYCKQVEEAGGLLFILNVLQDFIGNEKLNRQALKLLKVLAGNDDCKAHIIQTGGANAIGNSLLTHKASPQTLVVGLTCVAALSLRSPENSKALFDAGFPDIIVDSMKLHPENISVQKTSSWVIRNMVSRSRYQSEKFLALGVEELLQTNLKKFKSDCEYDFKAALRDLGCEVNLKEEWTGKGGRLTTQNQIK